VTPATGPPTPDPACTTIQAAITADLAPIGVALGSAVGAGTAGQASARRTALTAAGTAITKLGADLRAAGAGARSTAVRSAVTDASDRLDALVADPAFLSGITGMGAITIATGQLVQATTALTRACRP
jgi:hypothetical protein